MARGLIVLAAVLLAGCATALPPAPQRLLPPVELLQDCHEPLLRANTNGELAHSIVDLRAAIHACNLDKSALRAWAE